VKQDEKYKLATMYDAIEKIAGTCALLARSPNIANPTRQCLKFAFKYCIQARARLFAAMCEQIDEELPELKEPPAE
jgi:hypothetical protein